MRRFGGMLRDARKRYERLPSRDPDLICADGYHMKCDVLKLRKAAWTNDDPTKINSPTGGIFFSIWVTEEGVSSGRANYNIHSYGHRKLDRYRIASNEFCDDFRVAFKKLHKFWPNVSTEFGCTTLMEGWFEMDQKTFPREVLRLMKQFDDVAAIIDDLLKVRTRIPKRGRFKIKEKAWTT